MIDKNFGCYGGRVLRATRVGDGKKIRGAKLTPDETSAMPLRNRIALSNSSKIEFFPDPESMKPALTLAEINQKKIEEADKADKALAKAFAKAQKAQEALNKATARLEKAKTPATIKKAETALQRAMDDLAAATAAADNKEE